jgi:transcription-repair coupling factor (superfamily II helicase)
VLVPTTILAQQHYTTFTNRLAAFPVTVEMLSRFRSEKEQDAILRRLREGNVDILIGTHRLLQPDVMFKDLGLLIIDEEQRFGVTHKEQLKKMRTEVDVLTLTATPIPRTMYMSLVGVRDISTIDTPPEERLPVATYVGEYDDHLVRQAILRELDRGGQVFFVHNRVLGIEQIADRLAKIVPEARVGIGHGQMDEHELEQAMIDFVKGDIDVLLCTSIIESGLDIPNANTLIVDRSDRFGLAQLYQLRGRVGRGAARAYAYFLYDRASGMTEDARRRLEAIREANELGMGYSIAMRDL